MNNIKFCCCTKLLFVLLFFFTVEINAFAQSGQISCVAYKQIYWYSGEWGDWPNHWTTYKSEGRTNPQVRITTVNDGSLYRLQMYINQDVVADFLVEYDAELSAERREDWNDRYVNCYRDANGDYVYSQGVSLSHLAKNPKAWVTNEESKIYLWVFSEDYAILLK